MDEVDFLRKEGLDLRIGFAHQVFRTHDGCVDVFHDFLQESQCAVFLSNGTTPIPLIHVEGVCVVQLLVTTNGVHVCV